MIIKSVKFVYTPYVSPPCILNLTAAHYIYIYVYIYIRSVMYRN